MDIKRGDIFYADLSPVVGSEQGGVRPVLIIQNNVGNRYSPTIIAGAITSPKTLLFFSNSFALSTNAVCAKNSARSTATPFARLTKPF